MLWLLTRNAFLNFGLRFGRLIPVCAVTSGDI